MGSVSEQQEQDYAAPVLYDVSFQCCTSDTISFIPQSAVPEAVITYFYCYCFRFPAEAQERLTLTQINQTIAVFAERSKPLKEE